jgi:acetyl-CoA C-acetyltransferase
MSEVPAIVGVAQSKRHPARGSDLAGMPEPLDMMAEVAREALLDAKARTPVAQRVTSIRVVAPLSWAYANPAADIAERLGVPSCETVLSSVGGNSPQMLLNDACRAIVRGDHQVVVIVGAEANYTRRLARLEGVRLPWTPRDRAASAVPRILGSDRPGVHEAEIARSLVLPVNVYPVFENALRASLGRSIEEHQGGLGRLWSRFSEAASRNPHAWSRERLEEHEIVSVSRENRMVSFPYTVRMTANIQTDQAAALVLCPLSLARDAGIPYDRCVFPLSGAEAADHWFVSERADLRSSPAIRAAGRALLAAAGRGIDEVAHVDLYSCFPSAVEIGAAELGLPADDPSRPLTVTGGLSFAGGPGNNYATHSIASMVEVLRGDEGSLGLVSALGWFVTKHALGLYSTSPPREYSWSSAQAEVDALPSRALVADHDGLVEVESYTVSYERDGAPAVGIFACLLPDGRRAWGLVREPDVLGELTKEDPIGRRAWLRRGGGLDLL